MSYSETEGWLFEISTGPSHFGIMWTLQFTVFARASSWIFVGNLTCSSSYLPVILKDNSRIDFMFLSKLSFDQLRFALCQNASQLGWCKWSLLQWWPHICHWQQRKPHLSCGKYLYNQACQVCSFLTLLLLVCCENIKKLNKHRVRRATPPTMNLAWQIKLSVYSILTVIDPWQL